LQPEIPRQREIIATEPRLIANGIANIRRVRTLIATGGQENGRFPAQVGTGRPLAITLAVPPRAFVP
jgi:hypothetical protein